MQLVAFALKLPSGRADVYYSCNFELWSKEYVLQCLRRLRSQNSWSFAWIIPFALQWRHTGCDGVSNHQPRHCLLNRLFWRRSKKTSKLRVTSFCAGNSPVTGKFPAQMASKAENISIWWRHHGKLTYDQGPLLETLLDFIPSMDCNYIHYKVWDEIIYMRTDSQINFLDTKLWLKICLQSDSNTLPYRNEKPTHGSIHYLSNAVGGYLVGQGKHVTTLSNLKTYF